MKHSNENFPLSTKPTSTHFITIRLNKAIPQPIVRELKTRYDSRLLRISKAEDDTSLREIAVDQLKKNLLLKYDSLLDTRSVGPKYLLNKKVADTLLTNINEIVVGQCNIIAYTIMSNHVHFLIQSEVNENMTATGIFYNPKSSSAMTSIIKEMMSKVEVYSNHLLKRIDSFWDEEVYDLVIRDEITEKKVTKYILRNAVKAGHSQHWRTHEYTYLNPKFANYAQS